MGVSLSSIGTPKRCLLLANLMQIPQSSRNNGVQGKPCNKLCKLCKVYANVYAEFMQNLCKCYANVMQVLKLR
jgi:hypothetical protein